MINQASCLLRNSQENTILQTKTYKKSLTRSDAIDVNLVSSYQDLNGCSYDNLGIEGDIDSYRMDLCCATSG